MNYTFRFVGMKLPTGGIHITVYAVRKGEVKYRVRFSFIIEAGFETALLQKSIIEDFSRNLVHRNEYKGLSDNRLMVIFEVNEPNVRGEVGTVEWDDNLPGQIPEAEDFAKEALNEWVLALDPNNSPIRIEYTNWLSNADERFIESPML